MDFRTVVIGLTYFVAAVLFLVGLSRISTQRTARAGTAWIGWGLAVAGLATCLWPGISAGNLLLVGAAVASGGVAGWLATRGMKPQDGPRMIALGTGMGSGALVAVSAVELVDSGSYGLSLTFLASLAGLLGALSLGGSLVAFARLRGWLGRPVRFPSRHQASASVLLFAFILGMMLLGDYAAHAAMVVAFLALAAVAGVMFTVPVGDLGVPVAVALYNVLTGIAIALGGFVLANDAMIVGGAVAAAAAGLLTRRMGEATGRPLGSLLFGEGGDPGAGSDGPRP